MTQTDPRVIPLDGVHNFRRFGGYETADGRTVKETLFRSGQFSRATEADLETMDALGVTVVADLRRPAEREREPSHWPDRPGVRVLASDHAGHAEPPHLAFLRDNEINAETIKGFMTKTYERLPFDEGNQWVFAQGYRALAQGGDDDGFIVHCAAGKDRTGIFCAFLLHEMGVERDAIDEDYLLTNTAVDYDRILPGFQRRIAEEFGKQIDREELRAFMGVEPDYLDAAWAAVGGDPSRYLREILKLEPELLDRLRETLKRP